MFKRFKTFIAPLKEPVENEAVKQAKKKLELLKDKETELKFDLIDKQYDLKVNQLDIELQTKYVDELEKIERERERLVEELEGDE